MTSKSVFLFLASAALASSAPAADVDLPQLSSRGRLRVLVSSGESPSMFNLTQAGEPGFERELLSGFTRLHGLEIEAIKVEVFADIIPRLQDGSGDLITGIIDTPTRRELVTFSTEVLPARHLVVNRKPALAIETVGQFLQQKVGTVSATSWWSAAVNAGYPEAKLVGYARREPLFAALRDGSISALVMSVSDCILALRTDRALQPGTMLGAPQSAAWAMRKSEAKLRQALDDYLANVRKTPTWGRLVVKYFGADALAVLGKASMP